jgi:uncharacterized DUF497 family protein
VNEVQFKQDEKKNRENQEKHEVPFNLAQYAFADPNRVIAEDAGHSQTEQLYYCLGEVGDRIMTVRFTYRKRRIRIIGAGYWRKGRDIYEKAQR